MPRASPVLAHIGQSSGDDLPKECPGGEAEEADPQRGESCVCVDADHPMYLRLGQAVRLGLALEIAVADERTLLELCATIHLRRQDAAVGDRVVDQAVERGYEECTYQRRPDGCAEVAGGVARPAAIRSMLQRVGQHTVKRPPSRVTQTADADSDSA